MHGTNLPGPYLSFGSLMSPRGALAGLLPNGSLQLSALTPKRPSSEELISRAIHDLNMY